MERSTWGRSRRANGFSLLELVAVVTLIGIITAIGMVRYTGDDKNSIRKTACEVRKGEIDLEVQLWLRRKGALPTSNLSDIGADPAYFPKGLPTCPVDGSAYTIDPSTRRVVGHTH